MKKSIRNIKDNDNGDQIRLYIMETMNRIQDIRIRIENLQTNKIMLEECEDKLFDAYKLLIRINGLMGDVIGYTISDDVWQHQKITIGPP